ncbi:response regulator [soil metagenome]
MIDDRPVLVVEDSDDDFDTVVMAARRAGVGNRLVRAADAADALDAITQHPPGAFAFMLLDFNLPGVDGLSLLDELREDNATLQVPVVVLTTSVNPLDREAFRVAGVSAFHVKSVDHTDCLRTIESIFVQWLNGAGSPADADTSSPPKASP